LSEKKGNVKKESTSSGKKRIEAFIREEKIHDVLLA